MYSLYQGTLCLFLYHWLGQRGKRWNGNRQMQWHLTHSSRFLAVSLLWPLFGTRYGKHSSFCPHNDLSENIYFFLWPPQHIEKQNRKNKKKQNTYTLAHFWKSDSDVKTVNSHQGSLKEKSGSALPAVKPGLCWTGDGFPFNGNCPRYCWILVFGEEFKDDNVLLNMAFC